MGARAGKHTKSGNRRARTVSTASTEVVGERNVREPVVAEPVVAEPVVCETAVYEPVVVTPDGSDTKSAGLQAASVTQRSEKWMASEAITKLNVLPLEVLDIILQKSCMHWIFKSPIEQRDEKFIRSLISVDVCFYQRITRKRFKKEVWSYLKSFYDRKRKQSAIFRNNKDFLLKNIQPNDEFIDSLFSLDCITKEECHFIKGQLSNRDKNAELLQIVRFFGKKKCSDFARCLRKTGQEAVVRVVVNGGVVIKVKVKSSGRPFAEDIYDLRSRTKHGSHLIDKLMEKGIEILNSQLTRQTVLVWICCRSQRALGTIETLYESNQLAFVLFGNSQRSYSVMIIIDRNQFQKTVGDNLGRKWNRVPSETTLYDLPVEVMDTILHKSYLHWIFTLTTKQSDEDVFTSLISVDCCFDQRINRQRFKREIWRYFKGKVSFKHDISND